MQATARRDGRARTSTVAEHFDRCLGCMACLTSCPSGVQYDRLIELTRERVEQEVPRPLRRAAAARARLRRLPAPRAGCAWPLRFAALPAPGPFAPLKTLAPPWSETVSPPRETAGGGRAHRPGRPAHRLRAVGPLRRGEPRLGARPRRLRLRGGRALRRLLRGACAARGPARARASSSRTPHRAGVRRGRRARRS